MTPSPLHLGYSFVKNLCSQNMAVWVLHVVEILYKIQ